MVAGPETGVCRMCSKTGALEKGHVVPSFVFRWLKATAALPYIRTGQNPNVRLQDGWRRRWFCRACEDQIGRFEKAFAKELFPLIVKEQQAPYPHGEWLSRFVASIAWRTVMLYSEYTDAFDLFTPEQKASLPLALEQWRAFVHGETDTPGIHELHFIPMGVFADFHGDRKLPANINRYTLRAIEVHVACNATTAFAFVKMGPAISLGFIQPPPAGMWKGTIVALKEGRVGGKMILPVQFLDYFIDRAERTHASQRGRSARQKEKIRRAFLANLDRAAASETIRAVEADVLRFGMERVFPDDGQEPGQTE